MKTRPTLQAVCGSRFPAPLGYGDPIPAGRVERREVVVTPSGVRGVVVGRTAPVRPTLAALARGRSSELCAPGYLVEVEGRALAANARKVRELNRTPRDACPFHVQVSPADLRAMLQAAQREVDAGEASHIRDLVNDLPFPHHARSGPCCASNAATPEKVLERFEPWAKGRAAKVILSDARRAIPRTLRGAVRVERLEDVPAAMRAVQDHCAEQVREWLRAAETPRAVKFRKVKSSVRSGYSWKGSRTAK